MNIQDQEAASPFQEAPSPSQEVTFSPPPEPATHPSVPDDAPAQGLGDGHEGRIAPPAFDRHAEHARQVRIHRATDAALAALGFLTLAAVLHWR